MGGSAFTAFGVADVGPCTPGGKVLARFVRRWLAKIAPKAAIPTEPPICRNMIDPEVATPMSLGGTAFWTARTSTCMTMPRPKPITSMYSDVATVDVCTFNWVSSAIPMVAIAVPTIGNGR